MDGITTEVIDKLFLELSQITSAHTAMELRLMRALRELVRCKGLKELIDNGDALPEYVAEYARRKPSAWMRAREALAAFDKETE